MDEPDGPGRHSLRDVCNLCTTSPQNLVFLTSFFCLRPLGSAKGFRWRPRESSSRSRESLCSQIQVIYPFAPKLVPFVDPTEARCGARGREPSNHQLWPPRSPKARKPSRIPFYTASSLVESCNKLLARWRVESGAMIPARRWSGPGPARRLPVPHRLSSAGRPAELWR